MRLRIEIFVADMERTARFYRALGFTAAEPSGDPPYVSLRQDDVAIGVLQVDEAVDPSCRRVPAGTEIVLAVDDVRAVRDAALAAGLTLDADLQRRPWGLTDFRLCDPDGYYLRVTDSGQSETSPST